MSLFWYRAGSSPSFSKPMAKLLLSSLVALSSLAVSLAGQYVYYDLFHINTDYYTDGNLVYPAFGGVPVSDAGSVDFSNSLTDADTIASTVQVVDQKGGAAGEVVPNLPPPPVTLTALDGSLVNVTVDSLSTSQTETPPTKRSAADYNKVFDGTGTGPNDRDGSIEGTAYLTYTLVDNSTYNIGACLDFCDRVEQCGKQFSSLISD
jgi:hypothetical protein